MSSGPLSASSRHFFGSGSAYLLDFRIFSVNPGFLHLDSLIRHVYIFASRHNSVRRKIIKKWFLISGFYSATFSCAEVEKVEKVQKPVFWCMKNRRKVAIGVSGDKNHYFYWFPCSKWHLGKKHQCEKPFSFVYFRRPSEKNTRKSRENPKK